MQYIASLHENMEAMGYEKATPEECPKRGYWREFWVTRDFLENFEADVKKLTVSDNESRTPEQQIWAKIVFFLEGKKMVYPFDFHALRPTGHGVWEIKTLDVRIFGWFPCRDLFIAHTMADANVLHDEKKTDLWKPYIDCVANHIASLNTEKLSPVMGTETANVLSNRPY